MSLLRPAAPDPGRAVLALTVLRYVLALFLAIHGWTRLLDDGVAPFGGFLEISGFPLGFWIASAITAYEILGAPLLAWGRLVLPLTLGYVFIYVMGIVLVHAPHGWFVVGAGRNGAEYSVLLIVCLLLVGLQAWPRKTP